MTKKNQILSKQSVKKKGQKPPLRLWKVICVLTSIFFKVSIVLIGMGCLSLLFLNLYQYLITSPYIKLEQVVIRGVDEDIKRELMDISGLENDQSLLAINLNKIKYKMENHPWVNSAVLEKRFPHTLIVEVEKEIPRALVSLDKLFYMNRDGELFKEVELLDDKDYPVITGIPLSREERSRFLTVSCKVLDLLESEKGLWSYDDLAEIHISRGGEISLYSLSFPAVIKMGQGELQVKKDELERIIAHLDKTGRIHMVKAINLDYPGGAVVSFKKSG